MNKLQSKLSNLKKQSKMLLPATMIALMSVLNSGCVGSSLNERIANEEKKDLNENFTDLGEGVYFYQDEDRYLTGEEMGVSVKQFLSKHPELKIISIMQKEGQFTQSFIIITECK